MSSGFGLNGGVSRCFPFWQEVLACYVVNTTNDDDSGKKICGPVLEDYYECLHHKKEVGDDHEQIPAIWELQATRIRSIQQAYRKAAAANPRDDGPKAGAIRNLGLLDKEEDTKAVLGK
ncbi:hypothetical protein QTJ16_002193 [Diplocarpon rosae]|uniref:NADH dehydrogenase [ubiquinone] iron-sulfur protein 5 n=1 Tax=Diplocarpon rosae TaxID=946125 RepID=A0AAD9WA61_9HELO|nr:hypothetical protein QTJ16_007046 [Diplocarpon rosae]KAK2629090.1 hypothetical protein QTJ16_002193 [Diplocarpon rosae]